MSNIPQNQDSLGEKLKATDRNDSDIIYNSLKAATSFIPIPALTPLTEYFLETYIGSPATKRTRIFLNSVVEKLNELESKIESVNFENPVFQTTFMQACHIAARTPNEQKLEALRNVVLHSSIPSSLEDDICAMFLNWIDGFTPSHISILKTLHYLDRYDPGELDTYFPTLQQNRAKYNQILKDLEYRGLINLREDYITHEDDASIGTERKIKTFKDREDIDDILADNFLRSQVGQTPVSKTTELGKQFIEFIKSPSIQTESM